MRQVFSYIVINILFTYFRSKALQHQLFTTFIINPIPLMLLNCWVGIILAPAFILLHKIMKLRIIFEFYFRKKNNKIKVAQNYEKI